jgi:flagellar motility protein MotE (MotC chaperone)
MRILSAPIVASCLFAVSVLTPAAAPARPEEDGSVAAPPATTEPPSVVEQYCTNIRDAAADARIAWQMKSLRELEKQVEARIAELEARQADFEAWLRRREAFAARARENLVAVYANMRPDAAAEQLSILDDEEAASVLASLTPRSASAILNEMAAERAAQLAIAMAGPPPEQDEEAAR